jgi:WhiB family transcriptional regulator, redox-sensing transcriptional regulator
METRWEEARCATGEPRVWKLFFSDDPLDIEDAKILCRECPLRVECLRGAVDREEPAGVWGGHLFERGRAVAEPQPRGRPPKEFLRRQVEVERELAALGIG